MIWQVQNKPVKARMGTKGGPNSHRPPFCFFFMSRHSSTTRTSGTVSSSAINFLKSIEFNRFCSEVSVEWCSWSQSRLILSVTGSGGAGGLALLVEFQEAGFLYCHSNCHFVARGLLGRCQGPFLWSFGWAPLPVKSESWQFKNQFDHLESLVIMLTEDGELNKV